LDKYELAEILTAAADGIKGWSKVKEAESKLDGLRRICYNFCKATVMDANEIPSLSLHELGVSSPIDAIIMKINKFNNSSNNSYLKREADELYRQLTSEEPPKED
jgi:hypothetical protein